MTDYSNYNYSEFKFREAGSRKSYGVENIQESTSDEKSKCIAAIVQDLASGKISVNDAISKIKKLGIDVKESVNAYNVNVSFQYDGKNYSIRAARTRSFEETINDYDANYIADNLEAGLNEHYDPNKKYAGLEDDLINFVKDLCGTKAGADLKNIINNRSIQDLVKSLMKEVPVNDYTRLRDFIEGFRDLIKDIMTKNPAKINQIYQNIEAGKMQEANEAAINKLKQEAQTFIGVVNNFAQSIINDSSIIELNQGQVNQRNALNKQISLMFNKLSAYQSDSRISQLIQALGNAQGAITAGIDSAIDKRAQEAKRKEEARLKAEEEARAKAEEEAKAKAKAKAEAEAKAKAEAEKLAKDKAVIQSIRDKKVFNSVAELNAALKGLEVKKIQRYQNGYTTWYSVGSDTLGWAEVSVVDAAKKAEQEAKAKVEKELQEKSKAKAEAEVETETETEAKPKANKEANGQAKSEPRAKAERELETTEQQKLEQDKAVIQSIRDKKVFNSSEELNAALQGLEVKKIERYQNGYTTWYSVGSDTLGWAEVSVVDAAKKAEQEAKAKVEKELQEKSKAKAEAEVETETETEAKPKANEEANGQAKSEPRTKAELELETTEQQKLEQDKAVIQSIRDKKVFNSSEELNAALQGLEVKKIERYSNGFTTWYSVGSDTLGWAEVSVTGTAKTAEAEAETENPTRRTGTRGAVDSGEVEQETDTITGAATDQEVDTAEQGQTREKPEDTVGETEEGDLGGRTAGTRGLTRGVGDAPELTDDIGFKPEDVIDENIIKQFIEAYGSDIEFKFCYDDKGTRYCDIIEVHRNDEIITSILIRNNSAQYSIQSDKYTTIHYNYELPTGNITKNEMFHLDILYNDVINYFKMDTSSSESDKIFENGINDIYKYFSKLDEDGQFELIQDLCGNKEFYKENYGFLLTLLASTLDECGYTDLANLCKNVEQPRAQQIKDIIKFAERRTAENKNNSDIVLKEDGEAFSDGIKQNAMGDCWLLAFGISSADESAEEFNPDLYRYNIIKDLFEIKDNGDGTYDVTFMDETRTYSKEMVNNAAELSVGDFETRLVELRCRDYFVEHPVDIYHGQNPMLNGSYMYNFVQMLTGDNLSYNSISRDIPIDDIIYRTNTGSYVTICSLYGIKDDFLSCSAMDCETGEEVMIHSAHAYAVVRADKEYIYIKNPWDSKKTIKVPIEEYKKYFRHESIEKSTLIDAYKKRLGIDISKEQGVVITGTKGGTPGWKKAGYESEEEYQKAIEDGLFTETSDITDESGLVIGQKILHYALNKYGEKILRREIITEKIGNDEIRKEKAFVYSYDIDGKLIGVREDVTTEKNGELVDEVSISYIYNEKGEKIPILERHTGSDYNVTYQLEYDIKNGLTKRTEYTYDENDNEIAAFETIVDSNGIIIQRNIDTGNTKAETYYIYDSEGNFVKSVTIETDENNTKTAIITDKNGNTTYGTSDDIEEIENSNKEQKSENNSGNNIVLGSAPDTNTDNVDGKTDANAPKNSHEANNNFGFSVTQTEVPGMSIVMVNYTNGNGSTGSITLEEYNNILQQLNNMSEQQLEQYNILLQQKNPVNFDWATIINIATMPAENFSKIIDNFLYVAEREDQQFSRADLFALSNISDSQIDLAKQLLYLEDREDEQFSGQDICKLLQLTNEEFDIAKQYFNLKNADEFLLDGNVICALSKLSPAEREEFVHVFEIAEDVAVSVNKFGLIELSYDENKKVTFPTHNIEDNYQVEGNDVYNTLVKKDSEENVIETTNITPSGIPGYDNITVTDKNGNVVETQKAYKDPTTGETVVVQNLVSPNGTVTSTEYRESSNGSYSMHYVIKDKEGNVLLERNQSFTKVSDTEVITEINGKKYIAEFLDECVKISDGNNVYTLDLTSIFRDENNNPLPLTDECVMSNIEILKNMPGNLLVTLINENFCIKKGNAAADSSGYINMPNSSGYTEEEIKNLVATLVHEMGHYVERDDTLPGGLDEQQYFSLICSNPELKSIYERELEAFLKNSSGNWQNVLFHILCDGLTELVAESNMLINGFNYDDKWRVRAVLFQQFFPETIAHIAKSLDKRIENIITHTGNNTQNDQALMMQNDIGIPGAVPLKDENGKIIGYEKVHEDGKGSTFFDVNGKAEKVTIELPDGKKQTVFYGDDGSSIDNVVTVLPDGTIQTTYSNGRRVIEHTDPNTNIKYKYEFDVNGKEHLLEATDKDGNVVTEQVRAEFDKSANINQVLKDIQNGKYGQGATWDPVGAIQALKAAGANVINLNSTFKYLSNKDMYNIFVNNKSASYDQLMAMMAEANKKAKEEAEERAPETGSVIDPVTGQWELNNNHHDYTDNVGSWYAGGHYNAFNQWVQNGSDPVLCIGISPGNNSGGGSGAAHY